MGSNAENVQAIIFANVKVDSKPIDEIKVFGLSPIKHLYYALRFLGISDIVIVGQNIKKRKLNLPVKFCKNLAEVSAKKYNLIIFANAILTPDDIENIIKNEGIFVMKGDVSRIVAIYCSEDKFTKIKGLTRIDIEGCRKFLSKIREIECIFLMRIGDIKSAEEKIKERLAPRIKRITADGIVARVLYRKVSLRVTKLIADTNITPNQITVFATLLMMFGASLFLLKSRIYTAIAGFIIQLACIIDGCDGEIARLKYLVSNKGTALDPILDRFADASVILAIALTTLPIATPLELVIILSALFGSIMTSYSSFLTKLVAKVETYCRYDSRDVRCFIIFIFALMDKLLIALLIIALLTNSATILRVIRILKHKEG